jgi:hypothetical protein
MTKVNETDQNMQVPLGLPIGLSTDPTKIPNLKNIEQLSNKNEVAHAVIYEHADFKTYPSGGKEEVYFGYDYVGHWWNDRISSVIVVSGNWEFYEHKNQGGAKSNIVGPGYYYNVQLDQRFNMKNDTISSFSVIL